jgi:hypothetical protein
MPVAPTQTLMVQLAIRLGSTAAKSLVIPRVAGGGQSNRCANFTLR